MTTGLNALTQEDACELLAQSCGSSRWVQAMVEGRPYQDMEALQQRAQTVWGTMERSDILEAFDHHPRIGADIQALRKKFATTASLSESEQASVAHASEETLLALRDGNKKYEARYGHIFIVCATGKSAQEMLELLEARMDNEPDEELRIAAAEQAKITQIRLENIQL